MVIPPTTKLDRLLAVYGGQQDDELLEESRQAGSQASRLARAVRVLGALPIDLHRIPGMEDIAVLEDHLAEGVEPNVNLDDPMVDFPTLAASAARLVRDGRLAEALQVRQRLCRLALVFLGEEHRDTATYINALARVYYDLGDFATARRTFQRAVHLRSTHQGPDHTDTAISLGGLGRVLEALGDYTEAVTCHRRAAAIMERQQGPSHPHTGVNLTDLGCALHAMGDYQGARECHERSLAISREFDGEQDPNTAIALGNLAGVLESMGEFDAARSMDEESLAILESAHGPEHADTAWALNNLGSLLLMLEQYQAAREYLERAAAVAMGEGLTARLTRVLMLNNLGLVLHRLGDHGQAEAQYRIALETAESALPEGHPAIEAVQHNLSTLLAHRQGRPAPAILGSLGQLIAAAHLVGEQAHGCVIWHLPVEGHACAVALLLAV
jgi:tetratricopeptide (TPR) repeat protein